MSAQHQIRRTLAQPLVVKRIHELLELEELPHRNALARVLCAQLEFFDARGQPQISSCLKALREMEAAGQITLPPAQNTKAGGWTPRRLDQPVPPALGVPESAEQVQDLELIEVHSEAHMRIWNELIVREHPQGHRPMMGRQIRYLIGSAHGWLGAVGFAASALGLRARDEWIGWQLDERREHPDKNLCYIPVEEKESYRWIEGLNDCIEISAQMPGTSVLCVMDREADMFELFDRYRENPRVDLLVRAQHDRRTDGEEKLFASIRKRPVRMELSISVPRASARPKKGKRAARKKRPARSATLQVRWAHVQIHPPRWGLNSRKEPVEVWLLHLLETNPPDGETPVQWYLLTTLDLEEPQMVQSAVRWYCLRWRIEEWHRVIKSGCRAEDHTHRSAERLRRALAIDLVVAWRVMLMCLLGREQPDLPPDVLFSEVELKVLAAHAKKNGFPPHRA